MYSLPLPFPLPLPLKSHFTVKIVYTLADISVQKADYILLLKLIES